LIPVVFTWNGQAMIPLGRFSQVCERQFKLADRYRLDLVNDRTGRSERHYFDFLDEVWAQLPEKYGDRWPTREHLRKWALIFTGYCDQTHYAAKSPEEAERVAAFMQADDEFAVVTIDDNVVIRAVAKSQARTAMGHKEFQASKTAVMDYVSSLIPGVTQEDIHSYAGRG